MNLLSTGLYWLASQLARFGLVDDRRGKRTVDLAWPRVVTGFARMSQQLVDLAMIGIVLGPSALAGMAFAFAYWQIGNQLSLGLSGGTISLVSQRFGAEDETGIDKAIKQSVWVAIVLSAPITVLYWFVPAALIRVLGASSASIEYGAVYLSVVSLALVCEFQNKIASRVLVGVDDAITPMYVRGSGAVVNILLNGVFIFGLGLGVLGAALGTVVATVLTTGIFAWGFLGRPLPIVGTFPVHLTVDPPYFDAEITRQLIAISVPLMVRWIAHSLVLFPFLSIVSVFGTGAVAAFEVGRRVRGLINAPGWGFGLASSSLVGQQLGKGDEGEAAAYGWDILRFATVVYLGLAAAVIVFARPIARIFVDQPGVLHQTAVFIRVAAVAVIWMGIDGVATGVLRGAGDTRWPLYGKFTGLYILALPIAYLGTITPLGITAVYVALVVETFVPSVVSLFRFWSRRWISTSRAYRPQSTD